MANGTKLAIFGGAPIVPQGDSIPRWPSIDEADIQAVTSHLREQDLSAYEVDGGPLLNFEMELRDYFGVPHALLVANGTAAIQSAVFGLELDPDDEIIVPTITFPGTAAPILHSGGSIRLVDVDAEYGNPTPEQIANATNKRTRAVILAHAWGFPPNLPVICDYLDQRSIHLIEDAARAFGTRCRGKAVGSFGIAGCFSLHELKAVPGGEGGILLTKSRRVYERAIALGHYYRCKVDLHLSFNDLVDYRDSGFGLNLKIHPLAAALAQSQFRRLPARINVMKENRALLGELVSGLPAIKMQESPPWAEAVSYYGFNFHWRPELGDESPSRDVVIEALKAEGIPVSAPGNPPLHQLELFRHPERLKLPGRVVGSIDDADFPGAVLHFGSLLRFPTLFWPAKVWVRRYADAIIKILENMESLAMWKRRKSCYGRATG